MIVWRPVSRFLAERQPIGLNLKQISSYFLAKRQFLPHLGILTFALMAGLSNLSAARANDSFSVAMSDPQTTRAIIGQVDQFTPLGNDAAIYDTQTDTTLAMSNGYLDNQQLVSTNITDRSNKAVLANTPLDNSSKTITYTVGNGETLSGIGWKFGVELASIKYFNDISNVDSLKPGQTLKIPPAGYTVSADKIAQKDRKIALASRTTTTRSSSSTRSQGRTLSRVSYGSSKYPYGWCTYYASATRPDIPGSLGNAGRWLSGAAAQGFATGSSPAAGAVMVSRESSVGHVAIVESVSGDSFTVSEMNYAGWGIVSHRTISSGSGLIKGFIY